MTSGLPNRISPLRMVLIAATAAAIVGAPQHAVAQCLPDQFCVNLDAVSSSDTGSTSSSTLSWSHTVASGVSDAENLALVVGISIRQTGASMPSVTSVTYNSVSLASVFPAVNSPLQSGMRTEIWGLAGDTVATGQNTVLITLSTSGEIVGGAVSFTGVDPDSPFNATGQSATQSTLTQALSTGSTSYLVDVIAIDGDSTASPFAGQTSGWNRNTGDGTNPLNLVGAGSTKPASPVFSLMQWTLAVVPATENFAAHITEVRPFGSNVVELRSFDADYSPHRDHVALRWSTGGELGTLGFRVLRETEDGVFEQVNRGLVAGSALVARETLEAGYAYRWVDENGKEGDRYWLEEVETDGGTRRYGPYRAVASDEPKHEPPISKTLSRITVDSPKSDVAAVLPSHSHRPFKASNASAVQRALAADRTAVTIGVAQRGWYRIDQPTLVTAGLPIDVDPARLQLFTEGAQVPIRVTGGADGTLGPGDMIQFYGVGLDEQLTDTRVYWLVEGENPGMRIPTAGGGEVGTAIATLPNTQELRERLVYVAAFANGDEENFFGAVLASDPVERAFTIDQLDVASPQTAVLDITLRGFSEGAHSVGVELNGSYVATIAGQDQGELHEVVEVPVSSLVEGDNAVRLTPSGGGDITLVDAIRLEYPRRTVATSGELLVAIPDDATAFAIERTDGFVGYRVFDDGFESGDFNGWAGEAEAALVLDVSDPFAVVDLTASAQGRVDTVYEPGGDRSGQGKVHTGSGETQQLLQFHMPAGADRAVHAIAPGQSLSPAWVVSNTPSTITETAVAADAVFVAPRDLLTALEPLVTYRQSEGYDTLVVAIEDVYDEQTFGIKRIEAVQNLMTALNDRWGVTPQYLVLVGDASYDPRGYLGLGAVDLIPTRFVATRSFEAASDDWFGDVTGDGEPDMVVARLPVSTSMALGELVSKTLAYEQDETAWSKGLFVSDEDMGQQFEMSNLKLIDRVPSLTPEQVLVRELGPAGAQTAVANAINGGVDLVNYVGHGSVQNWSGDVLSVDSLDLISDAADPAVFTMMNCMTGYFFDAALDSLAEALLAHESGAVAVFAPTSITGWAPQEDMMAVFYEEIGNPETGLTLGQAVHQAKAASHVEEIRRTWVLLGDPMIRVR
jgi:hypothetical protein